MEGREKETEGIKKLSFERDPSRPGSRTDQRKDFWGVIPAETALPAKVVCTNYHKRMCVQKSH